VLSFVLAFLVIHGARYTMSFASGTASPGSVFRPLSLGLSQGFVEVAMPVAALAYVSTLAGAGLLLLRHARLRDLVPAGFLVILQALWFATPAALLVIARTPLEGLAFSAVWVSAAHALQYLWVTSYYARREDPSRRLASYLGRAFLAGTTVTIFPAVIFAPALFGRVPWDAGLAILLFSVVNLHHFILDGAVWKLRDGRVARVLIRDLPAKRSVRRTPTSRRPWFGSVVAVLGVASLFIAGVDLWEREFVFNRAGGDVEQMRQVSEHLAWIGRESPHTHVRMARVLAGRNDLGAALAEYRRSLAVYPTTDAWIGVGQLLAGEGHWREASDAFAAALEVEPDDMDALAYTSIGWMQIGRPDLARRSLERMLTLDPGNPETERRLRIAEAAEVGGSQPLGEAAR
jgi:hypothetical protein